MSVLDNVVFLLKQQNKKQKELTDYLGITKNAFTDWKSGRIKSYQKYLPQIAEFFGVSTDELLGITPSYPGQTIPYNSKNIIKIPVYGFVAAGEGMFAESNILDYETAEISDTTPDRKYFYLKIHGDSMYPIFIEGDYILVQQQTSVDSGDFAVALVDDCEGVVKRVVYGDDWIQLQSVNPMYPPRRFDGPDVQRIKIIGLVKSLKRKF